VLPALPVPPKANATEEGHPVLVCAFAHIVGWRLSCTIEVVFVFAPRRIPLWQKCRHRRRRLFL